MGKIIQHWKICGGGTAIVVLGIVLSLFSGGGATTPSASATPKLAAQAVSTTATTQSEATSTSSPSYGPTSSYGMPTTTSVVAPPLDGVVLFKPGQSRVASVSQLRKLAGPHTIAQDADGYVVAVPEK